MPSHSEPLKSKGFIPADKGKDYPVFDISGESNRVVELAQTLNKGRDELTRVLGKDFRSILASSSIKTDVEKWTDEMPEQCDLWFRLEAIDAPGVVSALGISRKSLFSITEALFEGNAKFLDEEAVKTRSITGTERRLLGRISNTILKVVGNTTDQPHEYWALSLMDEAPDIDAIWATAKVAGDEWGLVFSIAWPKSLFSTSESQFEASFNENDIRSALMDMRISARAKIAEIDSNFADLQRIRSGDILEFHMSENTPVSANGVECLTGQIFESSDRLGLKINQNLGAK